MRTTPQDDIAPPSAAIDERGAGMAEYALLMLLVALAVIAAWQGLASGLATVLSNMTSALN
jgi:Flp pilus assembly pilin Flp